MTEFVLPVHAEDLLQPTVEGRLKVESDINLLSMSKSDIVKIIAGQKSEGFRSLARFSLNGRNFLVPCALVGVSMQLQKKNEPLNVLQNENFDVLYAASR